MPVTKKAVAVLSLSAIAFFIAIILLSHDVIRLAPGPVTDYLGQTEIKIFNTYLLGEEQRLYIDMCAKYAYENAGGKAKVMANNEEFIKEFTEEFAKQLEPFNILYWKGESMVSAADYEISADENSIKGISEKAIVIQSEDYTYSFNPGFRVIFEEEVAEVIIPEAIPETCSAANGACKPECDTSRGESIIPETSCLKNAGIAQYCCKMPAEASAECVGAGGSCKSGCEENDEPLEISCETGKHCCKQIEETVPLLPLCTDMDGVCRAGPASGEIIYEVASCKNPDEFCFIKEAQNECESKGNECRALSCGHPSLAAEYIAIHAYDESCGTGRYCCQKRS